MADETARHLHFTQYSFNTSNPLYIEHSRNVGFFHPHMGPNLGHQNHNSKLEHIYIILHQVFFIYKFYNMLKLSVGL